MLLALEKFLLRMLCLNEAFLKKAIDILDKAMLVFENQNFCAISLYIMEVMPHRNKGTIALQKQIFFLCQQKPLRSPSPLRLTKLLNFFQLSNCTKCKNLSEFT